MAWTGMVLIMEWAKTFDQLAAGGRHGMWRRMGALAYEGWNICLGGDSFLFPVKTCSQRRARAWLWRCVTNRQLTYGSPSMIGVGLGANGIYDAMKTLKQCSAGAPTVCLSETVSGLVNGGGVEHCSFLYACAYNLQSPSHSSIYNHMAALG